MGLLKDGDRVTRTVGTLSNPEAYPTVEEMIERVEGWQREHCRWTLTHKGPDGTRFPPSWPLSYNETSNLVLALAQNWKGITDDLRERVERAREAMRGGEEAMVEYLRSGDGD
jgi:hypothetical protein